LQDRVGTLLVRLDGQSEIVIPRSQVARQDLIHQQQRQLQAVGLLCIDGERNPGGSCLTDQIQQGRSQLAQYPFALQEFIARMQCREFDGDARACRAGFTLARVAPQFTDGVSILFEIPLRVGAGDGRLAQHVEGVRVVARAGAGGPLQRFTDVTPMTN